MNEHSHFQSHFLPNLLLAPSMNGPKPILTITLCRVLFGKIWLQSLNTNTGTLDKSQGREILQPGALRPQLVEYIIFYQTDILQAPRHITLCCSVNLETNSAAFTYV